MHFNSFAEMIDMGGYAVYVWSSVFIVIAVLALLIVHSMTAKKRTLVKLSQEQQRSDKIAQAKLAAKQSQTNSN